MNRAGQGRADLHDVGVELLVQHEVNPVHGEKAGGTMLVVVTHTLQCHFSLVLYVGFNKRSRTTWLRSWMYNVGVSHTLQHIFYVYTFSFYFYTCFITHDLMVSIRSQSNPRVLNSRLECRLLHLM